jgi:pimeloyl-ACP methyl ester carboxylesterase
MRIFFTLARILIFSDPAGFAEGSFDSDLSTKDKQLFTRHEFSAGIVKALRQDVEGWTHEYTIERLDWPFKLEDIHAPTVLVFHGEDDTGVHPRIGEYVSMRIPSCDNPTIYSDEGHSVVYYRYEEIIQAMLEAWE